MSTVTLLNHNLKSFERGDKFPLWGATEPDIILAKAKVLFTGNTGMPTASAKGFPVISATRLGTGLFRLQGSKARSFDVWLSASVATYAITTGVVQTGVFDVGLLNKQVSSGTVDFYTGRPYSQPTGSPTGHVGLVNPPNYAEVNLFFFVDPLASY